MAYTSTALACSSDAERVATVYIRCPYWRNQHKDDRCKWYKLWRQKGAIRQTDLMGQRGQSVSMVDVGPRPVRFAWISKRKSYYIQQECVWFLFLFWGGETTPAPCRLVLALIFVCTGFILFKRLVDYLSAARAQFFKPVASTIRNSKSPLCSTSLAVYLPGSKTVCMQILFI